CTSSGANAELSVRLSNTRAGTLEVIPRMVAALVVVTGMCSSPASATMGLRCDGVTSTGGIERVGPWLSWSEPRPTRQCLRLVVRWSFRLDFELYGNHFTPSVERLLGRLEEFHNAKP